jgi:hypothetical protein
MVTSMNNKKSSNQINDEIKCSSNQVDVGYLSDIDPIHIE